MPEAPGLKNETNHDVIKGGNSHADGKVYTKSVTEVDTKSVWKLIPASQVLSVTDKKLDDSFVKIFPNPSKGSFTLQLNNLKESEIRIYDILGGLVYKTMTTKNLLPINKDSDFVPGVYLIKVLSKNNKVYQSKLIVK